MFQRVNYVQAKLLCQEAPHFFFVGNGSVGVNGLNHQSIYTTASASAESPATSPNEPSSQNQIVSNEDNCADIMDRARAAIKRMKSQLANRKVRVRSDYEVQKAALRSILTRGAYSHRNTRGHPDDDRCVNSQQSDMLIDEIPPFLDEDYPPVGAAAILPTATANELGPDYQAFNNGDNCADIMDRARAAIESMKRQLANRKMRVCSDYEVQKAALRSILTRGAYSHRNTRGHPDDDRCVNSQQSDMLIDELPPFLDEGYPLVEAVVRSSTENIAQHGMGEGPAE